MAKSIKKQLVFSKELLNKGERRAKKFGISFGEYLRYLVIKDIALDIDSEELENVSEEIEESIGIALTEIKQGRYGVLDSEEAITKFVDSLDEK